nr:hypothetical protein [uncultured Sphaerochaeta sp.]
MSDGKDLIGKRYLYSGRWWLITGIEKSMSGDKVIIEEPKRNGRTAKTLLKKMNVM